MTVWFTGDTHYQHRKVIEYCQRPFANVDDMGWAMIERWNDVVRPGDRVYHLGDVALCRPEQAAVIAKKLHGQKFLILGNHDQALRKNKDFLAQWVWARDLDEIKVEGQKITLCHYALRVWPSSHYGAWQLHGHSHGTLRDDPHALQLDVGVDCWGFAPVSFETLKTRMAEKTWRPVDHHGEI